MTKREIAALICKALAIHTLMSAINQVPTAYIFISEAIKNGGSLGMLDGPSVPPLTYLFQALPMVFLTIAALYLWFRADDVAAMMVKESATDTELEPLVVGPEAQALVFAGLGIYALLQVLPQIAKTAAAYIYLTLQDPYMHTEVTTGTMPHKVALLVELGLGLWLLLGASGLVQMLGTLRSLKSGSER